MPQLWRQTTLQRHIINLNLRIELVDNTNESGKEIASVKGANTINNSQSPPKTSKANFDDNGPSVRNDEAPPLAVREYENGEVDSMVELKERLQLAEKNCLRLEELRQKYRLRWLEENYQARVLEEYAPNEIDTCPPHQIAWDAPSPAQSEYNLEVEDERIRGCGNTGGIFRCAGITLVLMLSSSPLLLSMVGFPNIQLLLMLTSYLLGTLTRYHLHPAEWLHRLPDSLFFEEGSLCEPLAVALAGIERVGLRLGDPTLIWRRAQSCNLICSRTASTLQRSLFLDATQKIKAAANGPEVAIECSSVKSSVHTAVHVTQFGGKVFIIGVGKNEQVFLFMHLSANEIDVSFQYRYANQYPKAIRLVAGGLINLKPLRGRRRPRLVRHRFKLKDAVSAFCVTADPSQAHAARSYATKRGITGDTNLSTGNAATFLFKS
ncbi:uncharacterized protein F5891DRAFT_1254821 [Suillus fuscotomentosus]|uniref:Alcohol dehydrogenase-like C-terminal domain-containing protein n=1 Tax=Suillus fuscotomentosus TaxID=1912939 RepID=A0AAD4HEI7_9AGAM|nr:uncharacterized protein F5891DRAFT_1254821 [Suillus fuscotomentosus]KAG1894675.1 hypothetical protein F5891DRAFT_1254821 [Suillus fuscotomentosus]